MQFSFLRATKAAASTAVFAVALASPTVVPVAFAQGAGGQAAQAQPNWKDRAEYDLYQSIAKEQNPQQRLQLLNTWQDKYPQSDFQKLRLTLMITTAAAAGQPQKSVDAAHAMLKIDPADITALYYAAWLAPGIAGTSPSADQIATAETAANALLAQIDGAFSAAKKPATTSDADWSKAKNETAAIGHTTLGWAALNKKDFPTAEKEFEQSLQLNANNGQVSYWLGQSLLQQQKPELYSKALYSFARAAAYDGAGSLPAANRPTISAYFKKIYTQYHGSDQGADDVLNQAKTAALPADGFKIVSLADQQNKSIQATNDRLQNDAGFKIWYTIKQNIVGDNGDSFFNSQVKGALIPGGQEAKTFSGTVISVDPADKPTKIVLAVEDATKPDATLTFEDALDPADPIKVGDKLNFSGVADSYTKDPYMLTFKATAENLPDVKLNKPAPPHRAAPRRPARRR